MTTTLELGASPRRCTFTSYREAPPGRRGPRLLEADAMKRYLMTMGSLDVDPLTDPLGVGVEAASAQDALLVGLGALGRAGRLSAGEVLARVRDIATPLVHVFALHLAVGGLAVDYAGSRLA